jgi:hypothetical protein
MAAAEGEEFAIIGKPLTKPDAMGRGVAPGEGAAGAGAPHPSASYPFARAALAPTAGATEPLRHHLGHG